MLKRTLTGAVLTVLMGAALYFSYIPQIMTGICIVLSVFSVYEICRATGLADNGVYLTASMLLAVGLSVWDIPSYLRMLQGVYIVAVIGFLLMMLRLERCSVKTPVKGLLLELTVIFLFKAFPVLRRMDNGLYYLTGAVILSAVTDVAAFLVGRFFGKHKLIPAVSPNKTVEGAVGGLVFSVLIMVLTAVGAGGRVQVDYPRFVIYCVMASAAGQFGDLCMSSVKRSCKIKDFGNIFPGHGGMLDRFDSQLLVVPFTLLYCELIGGHIL